MDDDHTYTAFRRQPADSLRATSRQCCSRPSDVSIAVRPNGCSFSRQHRQPKSISISAARRTTSPQGSRPTRNFASSEAQDKPRTGPGRPKLGVVCREVSLLPRHWEWLEQQPGGMSVALRKLVDEARKRAPAAAARARGERRGEQVHVGHGRQPPGFEEASRALFANDRKRFEDLISDWPMDIRKHIERLVALAVRFETETAGDERKEHKDPPLSKTPCPQ